jgi:hypothetical protein
MPVRSTYSAFTVPPKNSMPSSALRLTWILDHGAGADALEGDAVELVLLV